MPLQILTLKLDGITAGDYLTWCRDPDPPALDLGLRSITIDADPVGDTITAILDWTAFPPPPRAAAGAAGLPLLAGVQLHARLTDRSHGLPAGVAGAAAVDDGQRVLCPAQLEAQRRTAVRTASAASRPRPVRASAAHKGFDCQGP